MKDRGTCITAAMKKDREFEKEIDYHRYWKDMYEKEHKLRQEAETETILVKGIGINSPEMKEAKETIKRLESEGAALRQQLYTDREEYQKNMDRVKLENNNLFVRVADALEVNEHHQSLNGKLQVRIAELEEDNRRLAGQVEDQVERARKAGL